MAEATACLTQLHPPALACAAVSPRTAPGSYSRLSPITLAGWSSLCCAWPRGSLTPATAHLAVSVGWFTPHARGVGREWGSSSSATWTPATPGSQKPSGRPSPASLTRRVEAPPNEAGCRRGDLNSHGRGAHDALNVARLPIPPLRRGEDERDRIRLLLSQRRARRLALLKIIPRRPIGPLLTVRLSPHLLIHRSSMLLWASGVVRTTKPEAFAAKRSTILDAARRLVLSKGYERMTIQDVLNALHLHARPVAAGPPAGRDRGGGPAARAAADGDRAPEDPGRRLHHAFPDRADAVIVALV